MTDKIQTSNERLTELQLNLIETSIIGGILIDNKELVAALEFIDPYDFTNPLLTKIFLAMIELHGASKPFDLLLLSAKLQDELPAVNVFSFLADMMNSTPCSAHVSYYAEELRKHSKRLELSKSLNKISNLNQSNVDLPDIIQTAQDDLQAISTGLTKKDDGIDLQDALKQLLDELDSELEGNAPPKIHTGYEPLDALLQGFRIGNLVVLGGRPGMGKTTFALNLVRHILQAQKKRVLFFSYEMGSSELLRSIAAMISKISLMDLKGDKLDDANWTKLVASISSLANSSLKIYSGDSSIGGMVRRAREHKQAYPDLGVIVIDYLQLMSKAKMDNRNLEIGAITRELKLLAGELQLPIILLSQLNRESDKFGGSNDKKPKLVNLRDSGSIEQDADIVMFVHRPIDTSEHSMSGNAVPGNQTSIIVAKNRSGPLGEIRLMFDGQYATFRHH